MMLQRTLYGRILPKIGEKMLIDVLKVTGKFGYDLLAITELTTPITSFETT